MSVTAQGAILLVCGTIVLLFCYWQFVIKNKSSILRLREKAKENHCITTARCVGSKIVRGTQHGSGKDAKYERNGVLATYEYSVNGKVYRKKYRFVQGGTMVSRYPDEITMYYSFRNPKRATWDGEIEAHKTTGGLWAILITILTMVLIGQLLIRVIAPEEQHVVFEDGDIVSGQRIWDAFVLEVYDGKSAAVTLEYKYTLGDPSRYDPEYYEEIKDDYPVCYVKELTFDGETFTITGMEEEGQVTKEYRYLLKYTGEPGSATAVFKSYVYYVLTNDEPVTWEEIEQGMFSSQADAGIDHETVFSDLIY